MAVGITILHEQDRTGQVNLDSDDDAKSALDGTGNFNELHELFDW